MGFCHPYRLSSVTKAVKHLCENSSGEDIMVYTDGQCLITGSVRRPTALMVVMAITKVLKCLVAQNYIYAYILSDY